MDGCKVKVCHIASGDLWAGAEVQIYNLVTSRYYRENVETVCILLNGGVLERRLREEGVDVQVVLERDHGIVGLIFEVSRIVRNKECELIHSHRYKENFVAVCVSKLCGDLKLVKTIYGLKEMVKGWKKVRRAFFYSADLMLSRWFIEKTIAVTKDIENEVGTFVPMDRLDTIQNSINTRTLGQVRGTAKAAPRGTGTVRTIGTFCRLVRVKGLDCFVKAAGKVLKNFHDVQFVIGGEGPEGVRLQELCVGLGLQERFRFPGFVDDVYQYISSFDIFVVSSHHEGFPTAALEAMALGVPVVATRVGGIPEVIEHRRTGILVEPNDELALAEGIETLLKDHKLYADIRRCAIEEVFDHYSNESQARKVLKLYKEINQRNRVSRL